MDAFPGRLALQQRVLPAYRAPFFDALAAACSGGLSVFAGQPLPEEHIATLDYLQVATFINARNRHFFNPASSLYQCWQSGLVRWLESWQPDALIVEANPRYLNTPRAIHWMHEHSKPVIGWGLGAPPVRGRLSGWRQHSRRDFLLSLDALIAYSQRGADEYHRLGFPTNRLFVAPNAAAPRPQKAPPERPAEFAGRPGILFVGRLQSRKRIDNLLQACAALPEALQPRLWVIGDGPARADFEALAQEIYPQAEFPGAIFGAELASYFAAADLFVLPGTGGLAVQEAMSHALPVIVAQGDGTQGDLVRPENGWLLPSDDLPALTAALQEALSDAARLRRMGAASYRIVDQEVNLEKMVAVFLQAIDSVTA